MPSACCVAHFQSRGALIAALDLNGETLHQAFLKRANDPNGIYLATDLTKRHDCQKALQSVHERFQRIDVLTNIAGGFIMGEAAHETSDQTWDFLFHLNLRSIMYTAAAVAVDGLS